MAVAPSQSIRRAAVVLAAQRAEEPADLVLERIQLPEEFRIAVAEGRQQIFRQSLVGTVIPQVEQDVGCIETLLRKGAVDDFHLRHAAPSRTGQQRLLLVRGFGGKLLPALHGRDPAVALADQSDEERPGTVDTGGAHGKHLALALRLGHVRGVHAQAEIDGLELDPPVAETTVQGRDDAELDDVPLEVHVLERGRNENVVSAPAGRT